MMERQIRVLLTVQQQVFWRGPAYTRPLKQDDFRALGGAHASSVSRVFSDAIISFEGEHFLPSFLISPSVLGNPKVRLSRVQAMVLCVVARELSGGADEAVVVVLRSVGVELARRTVNKYKHEMGATVVGATRSAEVAPTSYFAAQLKATVSSKGSIADLQRLVASTHCLRNPARGTSRDAQDCSQFLCRMG